MLRTLLAIYLGLVSATALSAASGTARDQLERFSNQLNSLSGRFEQTTTGQAGGEAGDDESNRGRLSMQSPRMLRWDYESPFEQQIVADGKRIWVYDIDLEQISVRPQVEDEASSPLAVLIDLKQLDRQFKVAEAGRRDGLEWLQLQPLTQDAQFSNALLGFAGNELKRMTVRDSVGATTEFRFSDWQRNLSLPRNTFVFVPPPGVDVIGESESNLDIKTIAD
jgi:outer membrane lipoprotein carrier protein